MSRTPIATGLLLVRPVTPGDFDAWLPLWDGYNAFYGRSGATALAPRVTETLWARGQGVGRALIEAVCEKAREAGSARVYWQTHETNQTAMRLYDTVAEKSGFIVYRKNL
jgi:predicted GNAT family acetyltransferase